MGEVTKVRRTLIVPNQAIATYVTQWKYDSHNRLLEMIYPDEEKITYSYNLGGLLEKVRGYKSYGYDYVTKLGYDKFEQRSYLKYLNGAETYYDYDAARRRLSNLAVYSGKTNKRAIMDNAYTYDAVSNVLSVVNSAPLPASGAGGQMAHTYTYDNLYRLSTASGTYAGNEQKTAGYNLTMSYDNMHRITSKKQDITQHNVQFDGTLNAGYDLTYAYNNQTGKKFQLANVNDLNYRTEETPDKKTENNHAYTYDANGNLIYVNTGRTKSDGTRDPNVTERKLRWDEENRLLALSDNGFVSQYWYDADGERAVKTGGDGEAVYVNGLFSGGNTQTAKFTLYASPYLVASQGGRYTKHIYIGSQRIVSKLGDLASYGADPRRIEYAGSEADNVTVDYNAKYAQQQQSIKNNYATFDVPYNGKDNNDYVDGGAFADLAPDANMLRLPDENDNPELFQFYYHPDHLGSSSFITNLEGDVTQHIEYVPFGEVFIEERNNVWNTPYLFNAKELDEETGLYYYGARYYNPRISLWLSTDPLQEKKPFVSTYTYTLNNPVKFIDPTGMSYDWVENKDKQIYWDKNATSQATAQKGETYLGKEGYAINEETGQAIHYLTDGTTKEFSQTIPELTVTPTYAYLSKNPSISTHNRTGYFWDDRDLAVWNQLKNSSTPIGVYVKRQLRTGNFEILSAVNYWNTYGSTLGHLIIISEYIDMGLNLTNPSFPLTATPKFNLQNPTLKSNITPSSSTNNILNYDWNSTNPTFNEFRTLNKGAFKGYKGRGTSTKAAWEAYKQLYGQ